RIADAGKRRDVGTRDRHPARGRFVARSVEQRVQPDNRRRAPPDLANGIAQHNHVADVETIARDDDRRLAPEQAIAEAAEELAEARADRGAAAPGVPHPAEPQRLTGG